MFAKFLVREWRESLGVVVIALAMMAAIAVFSFAGRPRETLYATGMFLLFFLPGIALMLGASGFHAEFRDNAWVYLFSRPIRKELVWLFKYLSLLSVLAFVIAAFMGLQRLLPGLDLILSEFAMPKGFSLNARDLPGLSLYIALPLMAFTLAFSLSPLSEKSFSVFFAALLLGTGLAWIVPRYNNALVLRTFRLDHEHLIWPFIAGAFVLASIWTVARADFSQPGRRIASFATRLAAFLVLAFGLGALVFTEGRILVPGGFYVASAAESGDNVYFQTLRGLRVYRGETGKTRTIDRRAWGFSGGFSAMGGRVAYLAPDETKRFPVVRLINADGTGAGILPLPPGVPQGLFPGSVMLSPDGRRIALLLESRSRPPMLLTMGLDGGEAESVRLDAPAYRTWHLVIWPAAEGPVICYAENAPPPRQMERAVLAIDPRTGKTETIAGAVSWFHLWVSPDTGQAAFLDAAGLLRVIGRSTGGPAPIEVGPGLCKVRWSRDGGRIAVSDRAGIRVLDFEAGETRRVTQSNYAESGFDWLPGNGGFAYVNHDGGEPSLIVLDPDFRELKKLPVTVRLGRGPLFLWGLEGAVLLKDHQGPLWRVDLASGAWKRVG